MERTNRPTQVGARAPREGQPGGVGQAFGGQTAGGSGSKNQDDGWARGLAREYDNKVSEQDMAGYEDSQGSGPGQRGSREGAGQTYGPGSRRYGGQGTGQVPGYGSGQPGGMPESSTQSQGGGAVGYGGRGQSGGAVGYGGRGRGGGSAGRGRAEFQPDMEVRVRMARCQGPGAVLEVLPLSMEAGARTAKRQGPAAAVLAQLGPDTGIKVMKAAIRRLGGMEIKIRI